MVVQLQRELDDVDYLDPLQSGFMPDSRMEITLVTLVDDLWLGLDRERTSLLFLLDFSVAFHTIDHGFLLSQYASLHLGALFVVPLLLGG